MTEDPTPKQVAKRLKELSAQAENTLQQDLHEGAETITYLLALLNECADYIEDFNEYDKPPRFIKAVREALSSEPHAD